MSGPPPLPEPPDPDDTITRGCLLGCGVQLAAIALGYGALLILPEHWNKYAAVVLVVLQWAILFPLIRSDRSLGYRERPSGLILSGVIGTLLSTVCGRLLIA